MPKNIKSQTTNQENREEFILKYYEHQYERMAKLEDHRLIVTNIIFTLSLIAFTFGFDKDKTSSIISGVAIPLIIFTSNIFAVLYINSTRRYARIHRDRAKEILRQYASYIFEIDQKIGEIPKVKYLSQGKFQIYLHILLSIACFIPVLNFLMNLLKK